MQWKARRYTDGEDERWGCGGGLGRSRLGAMQEVGPGVAPLPD